VKDYKLKIFVILSCFIKFNSVECSSSVCPVFIEYKYNKIKGKQEVELIKIDFKSQCKEYKIKSNSYKKLIEITPEKKRLKRKEELNAVGEVLFNNVIKISEEYRKLYDLNREYFNVEGNQMAEISLDNITLTQITKKINSLKRLFRNQLRKIKRTPKSHTLYGFRKVKIVDYKWSLVAIELYKKILEIEEYIKKIFDFEDQLLENIDNENILLNPKEMDGKYLIRLKEKLKLQKVFSRGLYEKIQLLFDFYEEMNNFKINLQERNEQIRKIKELTNQLELYLEHINNTSNTRAVDGSSQEFIKILQEEVKMKEKIQSSINRYREQIIILESESANKNLIEIQDQQESCKKYTRSGKKYSEEKF
jgi:hypothetical protein